MKSKIGVALLAAFALQSCGSSDGGGPPVPANIPPTASAGADQSANENSLVQLVGQGSDPDGSVVSYSWSQVRGPTVSFSAVDTAHVTVTTPLLPVGVKEDAVLRLTVADAQGATATDELTLNMASADYVLFLADKDTDDVVELYKYETQTDTVAKLSGPMVGGGDVRDDIKISPDGAFVAYRADQDTDGLIELYVAAIDGKGVTKLSTPTSASAGDVLAFLWSPDGLLLMYYVESDVPGVSQVFMVDRDGTNRRKIDSGTGTGGTFTNLVEWSPDGRYVAQVLVDSMTARAVAISTIDTLSGGANSVGITSIPAQGRILGYQWSPDSTRVAYLATLNPIGPSELYVAMADGSAVNRVNAPLLSGGNIAYFEWAPDGSRLAYVADQDTLMITELYAVSPDGSGPTKVNQLLVASGNVVDFSWAPDSSSIAYLAEQESLVEELFVSDPDGANNRKINPRLVDRGEVTDFWWSPDSASILYAARQDQPNAQELYVSQPDGMGNTKINGPLIAGGSGRPLGDPSDSKCGRPTVLVSFTLRIKSPPTSPTCLYQRPMAAQTFEVNGAIATGGVLLTPGVWSADSSSVAYVARQDDPNISELYLASGDGLTNTNISGPLVAGGNIELMFVWSP